MHVSPDHRQWQFGRMNRYKNHHGETALSLVPPLYPRSLNISQHKSLRACWRLPRCVDASICALAGRHTCPARYPGLRYISRAQCGIRYTDFSPHFLSTLSTLRLTSPVDADNLYRCESYFATMPPNVGQPQYMPPQQPQQQYQQQYLPPSSSQQLYLNLAQHLQPPRTSIHLEGSSSSILSSSGILNSSTTLSSSSLTQLSSTSSTSSRPCRRNSALHQRSTPAPHTPNTHGTPCQRTLAWPLPISQQMLQPCERLTRQCQRHPKPQQSPNPKEQQTSSSLTFIRFLRNT